jgi:hypothetical protein
MEVKKVGLKISMTNELKLSESKHMVVGFTTNLCNQCLSPLTLWVQIPLRWCVLDASLCEKKIQGLVTGRWFPGGGWGWEALDWEGGGQVILRKTLPWTLVSNVFGECHSLHAKYLYCRFKKRINGCIVAATKKKFSLLSESRTVILLHLNVHVLYAEYILCFDSLSFNSFVIEIFRPTFFTSIFFIVLFYLNTIQIIF